VERGLVLLLPKNPTPSPLSALWVSDISFRAWFDRAAAWLDPPPNH